MPTDSDATMTLPAAADHDANDVEITSAEAWDRFDAFAQRVLSISGSEFVYRLESGALDLEDSKVTMVRAMLPLEHEPAV